MIKYLPMILLGLCLGTAARLALLKIDYRQYPGYPHGYIVHCTLGFIAAALGTLVIPALLEENYIAVTFLGAAAQQFREIRTMEREFLTEIEATELVPRREAYIEGIAQVFEARNYLAMITALSGSIGYYIGQTLTTSVVLRLILGVGVGGLVSYSIYQIMDPETIGDIASIKLKELDFTGPGGKNIKVEDTILMNLGLEESLKKWQQSGLGIVITPNDISARATLANTGQRQAVIHDLVNLLGVKLDVGVQDYTPIARLGLETGKVYIIIIPRDQNKDNIKRAVENTPLLESSRRRPLHSNFRS
jgi:hypothetical protein